MLGIQPHLLCPTSLACCQVSYEELLKNRLVALSLNSTVDLTCREYRWFHEAPEQTYTRGAGPNPGPLAHCTPTRRTRSQSINQTIFEHIGTYNQNKSINQTILEHIGTYNQNKSINQTILEHIHIIKINQSIKPFGNTYYQN